jgi:hypothetical protein
MLNSKIIMFIASNKLPRQIKSIDFAIEIEIHVILVSIEIDKFIDMK